jgi:hypothetical protein
MRCWNAAWSKAKIEKNRIKKSGASEAPDFLLRFELAIPPEIPGNETQNRPAIGQLVKGSR